jgi:hypothetical protein
MDDERKKKLVFYLSILGKIAFGIGSLLFILMFIFTGIVMPGANTNPLYWIVFIAWIYTFVKIYNIHL